MNDRRLSLTHVLHASIDEVWDAWTNPQSMQEWLAPEGMTTPDAIADLKIGGKYRVVMNGQDMSNPSHNGDMVVGGEYLEIDKPKKLVFTWLWEGSLVDTHTTTITLQFKKLSDTKTEMTITHSGFADDQMQQMHSEGWISTLRKLDCFLET